MSLPDKYEIAIENATSPSSAVFDVLIARNNDWDFCTAFMSTLEKYIEEKVEDSEIKHWEEEHR